MLIGRWFGRHREPLDGMTRVPTRDGSFIALHRRRAHGEQRFLEPVILCPGVAANHRAMDFDERYSLARYLSHRGFDTWVLELRGRSGSGPLRGANFDDEVIHDVGAALEAVCASSQTQALWVGHSKGGLLGAAHLCRFPHAPIAAVTAIGSPFHFREQAGFRRLIQAIGPALHLPLVPISWVTRTLMVPTLALAPRPVTGLPPAVLGKYLMNADNMEVQVVRRAVTQVSASIPGGVARQFARWVKTGEFDGDDGFDYRAKLHTLRLPLLAIAGQRDMIAPPQSVRSALDHWGGPSEYAEFGLQAGSRGDYGHGDLLLGRSSPEEIFPRVARFLTEHATRIGHRRRIRAA